MSAEPVTPLPSSSDPITGLNDLSTEDKKAPVSSTPALEQAPLAPAVQPDSDEKKVAFNPEPEEITTKSPLEQFFEELPAIIKEADHGEMWEVQLNDSSHVPTSIVLEKFLRANGQHVGNAKAQLIKALIWRKKMDPVRLLSEVEFDRAKFGGLGYVTVYEKTDGHGKEIVTWNIYGAVKDNKATFGNVEEFVKWRAALMELSVHHLDLAAATEPIPIGGIDQYQMIQVHDYNNVSFLRMDPAVKAASKETIETFSMAYPELLKQKFFVNVPLLMGWVFAAMKLFLSKAAVAKFHPLSYGSSLAGELGAVGSELPEAYGGKGKLVSEGLTVQYAGVAEDASAVEKKAEKL